MEKQIVWNVSHGIGRLTFNRPEQANSFGLASRADMLAAINQMAESDVRVVVISGMGRFFCTGGDVREFQQNQGALDSLIDEILAFVHPLIHKLASLPIPVISAVNGPLGGAGIGFALCADFVWASDTVKLRGGYCGIALSPDAGASYFLTRRVGASKAKQIFMRNRSVSADECLSLGIVDQVFPADQLMAAVDGLAQELAIGPTSSFGRVKALCDKVLAHDLQSHLELEHGLLLQGARSADCREGIASFLERRSPHFSGS